MSTSRAASSAVRSSALTHRARPFDLGSPADGTLRGTRSVRRDTVHQACHPTGSDTEPGATCATLVPLSRSWSVSRCLGALPVRAPQTQPLRALVAVCHSTSSRCQTAPEAFLIRRSQVQVLVGAPFQNPPRGPRYRLSRVLPGFRCQAAPRRADPSSRNDTHLFAPNRVLTAGESAGVSIRGCRWQVGALRRTWARSPEPGRTRHPGSPRAQAVCSASASSRSSRAASAAAPPEV